MSAAYQFLQNSYRLLYINLGHLTLRRMKNLVLDSGLRGKYLSRWVQNRDIL